MSLDIDNEISKIIENNMPTTILNKKYLDSAHAQLKTLINRTVIEELNLLDNALFPPPYKRINFNKLKDYKINRIAKLQEEVL